MSDVQETRPWTPDAEPSRVASGAVTLVEGSSFCISSRSGDLHGSGAFGVFFRDTRILSQWDLRVDGDVPESLAAMTPEPYRGIFLGRLPRHSGRTSSSLIVHRERWVGNGLREDMRIRNTGCEPTACTVTLAVAADFADLFEVKEERLHSAGERHVDAERERLLLGHRLRGSRRGTVVEAPGGSCLVTAVDAFNAGSVSYSVVVPARGEWSTSLLVRPVVDDEDVAPSFPLDRPLVESVPVLRWHRWREDAPLAAAGHEGLARVVRRSQQDLGALRIFDPEDPSLAAVAAGAPWFMALFGRDSLLTSYMTLPIGRHLAVGTLRTLARHQGVEVDPLTEEEPGRILHEARLGIPSGLSLGGGGVYYGTADATPLFVVVLGELARWGASQEELSDLLPHADRALDWIDGFGDRDGDGFVEYERATDRGLQNQGWKDSWDGINFADGRVAEPPIALCEVQGYVYAAFLARARLARRLENEAAARRWVDRAAALKRAFNERFWIADRGWFAVALDRHKEPVDACASNMGHCLWTGIVDTHKASRVADHLLSPSMFSGWGVRTLSSAMDAYDPVSYHNGSVWPHDNALIAAGLMRYGFVAHAQRVAEAVLEAAERFGERLPELFCGFDRDHYPDPVPYPTSCSPQAWAAATPVELLRTLLRLEPELPDRRLWLAPAVPPALLPLRVDGLALAASRVSLAVSSEGTTVEGLPPEIDVRMEPRQPVDQEGHSPHLGPAQEAPADGST